MEEQRKELEFVTNVKADELARGDVVFVNGFRGLPQRSPYSSDGPSQTELVSMGYVGIYKEKGGANFQQTGSPFYRPGRPQTSVGDAADLPRRFDARPAAPARPEEAKEYLGGKLPGPGHIH